MTAARARRPTVPFACEGTVWEMAHACLFLLSHEASYVNADALVVDGGLSSCLACTTPATQSG